MEKERELLPLAKRLMASESARLTLGNIGIIDLLPDTANNIARMMEDLSRTDIQMGEKRILAKRLGDSLNPPIKSTILISILNGLNSVLRR